MAVSEIRRVPIRDVVLVNANSIKGSSAPSQIEYIDISSVGTGEFTEPPKVMSFADAPSRARRIVKAGDTILSTVRPNRRSFLFLAAPSSIAVASTGFAVLTPTPNVDARYLYYWVTRQDFTDYLSLHAKGAAYPAVSAEDIGNGEIELPPLPIQRRIAGILSAYDELIENSQRRIKILEAMARALYREWFVHFRFPGHESVPRVPSSLGEIPQGWEVKPFSGLAAYVNGYAFKPDDWGNEGKPIIKIKELKSGVTADTPRNSGDGIPEKYNVRNGDVLFSWSADLDAYLWMGGEGLLNQHLFNVLPFDSFTRAFCFHSLKEAMPRFRALSLGATMHHIKRSALDQVSAVVPPEMLLHRFEVLVEPMHEQLINLTTKITNLRRTRDLLLPRLLSGQIDMEAIDA